MAAFGTPRLCVVDGNAERQKEVLQVLRRVVGQAQAMPRLEQVPPDGDYDLIVAHYDGMPPQQRAVLFDAFASEAPRKTKLLLLSGVRQREELSAMFSRRSLTNLVASTDSIDADEFIVTVQKILRADIFGLEKYFMWGVLPLTGALNSSTQRGEFLDAANKYADQIGIPRRLAASLQTVLDEFMTNAIYNAPVDAQRKPRFAHVSRTQTVAIDANESIQVKLCCDGRRLGVSIRDSFGSLTLDTIQTYLAKCFQREADQVDDKPGGAGLGFYQIFDALSHFVINIQPNVRTEMIGLIDVRGSYKDFVMRGKSFNVFVV